MANPLESLKKKVMDNIEVDPITGCWVWQMSTSNDGYGRFQHKGTIYYTHRVMKDLPEGKLVCHHCDNPPCCNPDHLFVGTKKDNAVDMVNKGRKRGSARLGSKHHKAKLDEHDVYGIKILLKSGNLYQREIAEMFGVSQLAISNINVGRNWSHVQL